MVFPKNSCWFAARSTAKLAGLWPLHWLSLFLAIILTPFDHVFPWPHRPHTHNLRQTSNYFAPNLDRYIYVNISIQFHPVDDWMSNAYSSLALQPDVSGNQEPCIKTNQLNLANQLNPSAQPNHSIKLHYAHWAGMPNIRNKESMYWKSWCFPKRSHSPKNKTGKSGFGSCHFCTLLGVPCQTSFPAAAPGGEDSLCKDNSWWRPWRRTWLVTHWLTSVPFPGGVAYRGRALNLAEISQPRKELKNCCVVWAAKHESLLSLSHAGFLTPWNPIIYWNKTKCNEYFWWNTFGSAFLKSIQYNMHEIIASLSCMCSYLGPGWERRLEKVGVPAVPVLWQQPWELNRDPSLHLRLWILKKLWWEI